MYLLIAFTIIALELILCLILTILNYKNKVKLKNLMSKSKEISKNYIQLSGDSERQIQNLFKTISDLSDDNTYLKERVIEVEDGVKKSYGVKIRNEVTEVVTDFSKLEMVVMISGVGVLLKGTANPDDAEIYVNLNKKLQGFIDDMKEDEAQ